VIIVSIVLQQKPAQSSGSSVITCNDIPLVRQHGASQPPMDKSTLTISTTTAMHQQSEDTAGIDDDDGNFVYDVYRTDDDQFDFQSLERVLAVQALR